VPKPAASTLSRIFAVADRARRKIFRRLILFLFILYMIAYLDRANVAFAKVFMSAAVGFSEAVFGLGAGIFYAGYILLEIPGALIVERWSAKIWMSRIMITWGLCTAWVTTLAAIQAPTATVVNKAILSKFHRSSSVMMGGEPGYACRCGFPISALYGLVNGGNGGARVVLGL
jgi:sugar phosphate permease